jgi:hypothetical protein
MMPPQVAVSPHASLRKSDSRYDSPNGCSRRDAQAVDAYFSQLVCESEFTEKDGGKITKCSYHVCVRGFVKSDMTVAYLDTTQFLCPPMPCTSENRVDQCDRRCHFVRYTPKEFFS